MSTLALISLLLCSPVVSPAQNSFEELVSRAHAAQDSGGLAEAASLYKQALAVRPSWAEGWWSLGTLLYDRDDYEDAAAALHKAVDLTPQSGIAMVMLGLAEAKTGHAQEALAHIQKGRELGIGDNPGVRKVMLYTEGELLVDAGEFGAAEDVLRTLAREGLDQQELRFTLGRAVLGVKPASALDADARAIVLDAGFAECLAARGDREAARRAYTALTERAPKFHNVHFAFGRFLVADHDNDKAIGEFQREIDNTPNHLLARLGIAALKAVLDPAGGLPYAEQAVKLAPQLGESHYLLGVLLLDTGAGARALTELETARRLAPHEAKVHFALARAYSAANRKEDAARSRAEFTRLNQER